mmetsp:Transcript_8036/g.8870  ORF Transcript_8036/g.8870 Transcript_8036/m.8870 type:complete len:109 (-) Transcript_8036:122-448(-)
METISCKSVATVPVECHRIGAKSAKDSRFLDNSKSTTSRFQKRDKLLNGSDRDRVRFVYFLNENKWKNNKKSIDQNKTRHRKTKTQHSRFPRLLIVALTAIILPSLLP